jgi:hypothetical protein
MSLILDQTPYRINKHAIARISYWHCMKEDTKEKWQDILQLYNLLLQIDYSPELH